jgi:hypothetical protein
VEQQYAKAVVIVLKTRGYVNTISHELNLSDARTPTPSKNRNAAASQAAEIAAAAQQAQTQALVELLNRIDELCIHLAVTIRKSVLNLPTSQVRMCACISGTSIRVLASVSCVRSCSSTIGCECEQP